MKFLKQFSIILLVSFLGEVLHALIPLPIPASIYGILLMFAALCTGVIRLEAVSETGHFLVQIMPVMFIPAVVGLVDTWAVIRSHWVSYAVIVAATTVLVMGISGRVTQRVIRRGKGRDGDA